MFKKKMVEPILADEDDLVEVVETKGSSSNGDGGCSSERVGLPLSDGLQDLLSFAETNSAPTPAMTKKLGAEIKAKAAAAKGAAKAEVKASATKKKTEQAEISGPFPPAWLHVVESYDPDKNPGVEKKVLLKRAHSSVYHMERAKLKRTRSPEGVKAGAQKAAQATATKYREMFGV